MEKRKEAIDRLRTMLRKKEITVLREGESDSGDKTEEILLNMLLKVNVHRIDKIYPRDDIEELLEEISNGADSPFVFVGDRYIGGLSQVQKMKENGLLEVIARDVKKI